MGSHVMQYGSLDIDAEPAADYLGARNTGAASTPSGGFAMCRRSNSLYGLPLEARLRNWQALP